MHVNKNQVCTHNTIAVKINIITTPVIVRVGGVDVIANESILFLR